jgi:RNA polymerase sigma-70 factor, ECF subfamily
MFMNISNTDYQTNDSTPPRDAALADALIRMRPALTNRARAIVGNRLDAEDAVQEAAVRAWRSRGRFRTGADPAPWLRTIVTRTALDLARDRVRRGEDTLHEPVQLGPSAEESTMRAEVMTTIEAAAARLSPSSRRVLMLHDVAGYTSHEIAHLDNLPYHTVRTRLRRARLSLRNELNELKEAI